MRDRLLRNGSLALGFFALSCLGVACESEPIPVTTVSTEAYDSYQAGLDALRRFELQPAREKLEESVELDPDFAIAYAHLSTVYYSLGESDRATVALDRAYELKDSVSEIERLQIEHRYSREKGDVDTAKRVYDELLERHPDHSYTLALRAWRTRLEGDYEGAKELYAQILEQDPTRVDMHNMLGYMSLEEENYDEAVDHFRRYVFYAPEQANPHDSLAEAYLYMGQYDDSIREYEAALEIDPTFYHSAGQLVRVYAITGQLRRAGQLLEEYEPLLASVGREDWYESLALEIDYLSADWTAMAARAERRLKTWDELQAAGYLDPDSDVNLSTRLKALGEALQTHAFYSVALLRAGELAKGEEAARQTTRWIDSLQEMVKDDPNHAETPDWMRLLSATLDCEIARARGNPGEGIHILANALELSNQSAHELLHYRVELAKTAFDAGYYALAKKTADRVLTEVHNAPRAHLVAAKACAKLGLVQEALAHLGEFADTMINADSDHPAVVEARALTSQFSVAN